MPRGRQRRRSKMEGYRNGNAQAGATSVDRHNRPSPERAFRNNAIYLGPRRGHRNKGSDNHRRNDYRAYQPSRSQYHDHPTPNSGRAATPPLRRRCHSVPTLSSDHAISTRLSHSEYVRKIRDLLTQGTVLNTKMEKLLNDLRWFQPDADDMEWERTTTTVMVRDLPRGVSPPWNEVKRSGFSAAPTSPADVSRKQGEGRAEPPYPEPSDTVESYWEREPRETVFAACRVPNGQ